MRKYLVIMFTQFFVQLSYKFDILTRLFNSLLSISLSLFAWNAIYLSSNNTEIGSYTRSQMLIYIVLVNIGMSIFSPGIVVRLGSLVRSGKLTMHLLRPYSFLGESLASYMGERFMSILFYCLMIPATLFIGYNASYAALLLLLFFCNLAMFFLMISLVSNLGFWLIQMWPLRPVITVAYSLLGGLFFPLNLLPQAIYHAISKNPFALVGYQFVLALQGELSTGEVAQNLFYAVLWSVLFYGLYKLSFARGLRKYEGMGA